MTVTEIISSLDRVEEVIFSLKYDCLNNSFTLFQRIGVLRKINNIEKEINELRENLYKTKDYETDARK